MKKTLSKLSLALILPLTFSVSAAHAGIFYSSEKDQVIDAIIKQQGMPNNSRNRTQAEASLEQMASVKGISLDQEVHQEAIGFGISKPTKEDEAAQRKTSASVPSEAQMKADFKVSEPYAKKYADAHGSPYVFWPFGKDIPGTGTYEGIVRQDGHPLLLVKIIGSPKVYVLGVNEFLVQEIDQAGIKVGDPMPNQ